MTSFLPRTPLAPSPLAVVFGVGVKGILDSSGVRRGSRWLRRGPSFSLLLSSDFGRIGLRVEVEVILLISPFAAVAAPGRSSSFDPADCISGCTLFAELWEIGPISRLIVFADVNFSLLFSAPNEEDQGRWLDVEMNE